MLELYHHGSSVCAAKVRFVLEEKNLKWTGHYVDLLRGDQFEQKYIAINPKAVVPTLIHDGRTITESSIICEYIDEVYDRQKLMPCDAYGRTQARLWMKAIDEIVHPACAVVTFMISHRHTVLRLGKEGVEKFLSSTPPTSITPEWKSQKRAIVERGFEAPGAVEKLKLYVGYLDKMEQALQTHQWLIGSDFTMADVAVAPYVNRLAAMSMSGLWEGGLRPNVSRWFQGLKQRPSFEPTFVKWMPESLTEDMRSNGLKSWPDVTRALGI
jgi:glutathione S-transferase